MIVSLTLIVQNLGENLENFNMSTARLRVLFMCSYSIDACILINHDFC